MPAPIPYYPGGTYTGVTRLTAFHSVTSGQIDGTVTVPSGATTVIVRFRRLRAAYADTDYAVANPATDRLNAQGETLRDFSITGLTPGRRYAILSQAGDGSDVGLPSQEYIASVEGAVFDRSAYLPVGILEHTVFPLADGKDLRMQVDMIEEQWERFYPEIEYQNIKTAVTPAEDSQGDIDYNVLTGEAGATKFDPLWGESMPELVADTGEWVQPHGNDTYDVDDDDVFYPAVKLRARVQREAQKLALQRWGFNKVRDIILTIPVSILDRHGVTCAPGDVFTWDGDMYKVLQYSRTGYWKNTNQRLYVTLNCEHKPVGS